MQLSSFVGREEDLAKLGTLLEQHGLVTLLGSGGIGKTRLAIELATGHAARFAEGVAFVDLSALRDPELVPSAMASSLGLREQSGEPITATVAENLGPKQLLLVLDNREQLLPPAARSVAELLAAAPELRALVTSRPPLRIRGERENAVPALATASPDRLDDQPPSAVALFVERGRAIRREGVATPLARPVRDRWLEAVRDALPKTRYEALWREGERLDRKSAKSPAVDRGTAASRHGLRMARRVRAQTPAGRANAAYSWSPRSNAMAAPERVSRVLQPVPQMEPGRRRPVNRLADCSPWAARNASSWSTAAPYAVRVAEDRRSAARRRTNERRK